MNINTIRLIASLTSIAFPGISIAMNENPENTKTVTAQFKKSVDQFASGVASLEKSTAALSKSTTELETTIAKMEPTITTFGEEVQKLKKTTDLISQKPLTETVETFSSSVTELAEVTKKFKEAAEDGTLKKAIEDGTLKKKIEGNEALKKAIENLKMMPLNTPST